MFDIIVIGAGPAGSNAARILAHNNLSTLIVDKRQEIGAPVRCGEAIHHSLVTRENIPFDSKFVAQEVNGITIYGPKGTRLEATYRKGGWVVERKILDKYLATLAADEGARVECKTRALDVRVHPSYVEVDLEHFGNIRTELAKAVIIAEGAEGYLSSKLGFRSKSPLNHIDSGAQYEMVNLNLDETSSLVFFLNEDITPKGYAWIFPKGKSRANVGVVTRGNSGKTAMECLNDFIQSRPELSDAGFIEVNSGTIPIKSELKSLVDDRVLIIGDAAHQINPIHAGGVAEGLEAGRYAANTCIKANKVNDFSKKLLNEYTLLWDKGYGKNQKRLEKLRAFLDLLTNADLEYLFNHINSKDLISLGKGSKELSLMVKLVAKRPSLLRKSLSTLKG